MQKRMNQDKKWMNQDKKRKNQDRVVPPFGLRLKAILGCPRDSRACSSETYMAWSRSFATVHR